MPSSAPTTARSAALAQLGADLRADVLDREHRERAQIGALLQRLASAAGETTCAAGELVPVDEDAERRLRTASTASAMAW